MVGSFRCGFRPWTGGDDPLNLVRNGAGRSILTDVGACAARSRLIALHLPESVGEDDGNSAPISAYSTECCRETGAVPERAQQRQCLATTRVSHRSGEPLQLRRCRL
jgi:hypothetical protein